RARGEHNDPVESERDARAVRQTETQRLQQALVDWRRLHGARSTQPQVGVETCALLDRIRQFVKAVRELDTFEIDLEAFGDTRVVRLEAREGGLRRRVVVQEREAAAAEFRTDERRNDQIEVAVAVIRCQSAWQGDLPARQAGAQLADR